MDIEKLQTAALKRLQNRHRLPQMDREEVAQDALIALVRYAERFKVEEPAALLNDIIDKRAATRATELSRRAAHETPAGGPDILAALSDGRGIPSTTINDHLFTVAFDEGLRALPEEERDAYILYELRGVDQYEAALLLDIPAKTVVSRSDRARRKLGEELA